MKTCFFIGHRDAPLALQKQLDEVVEKLASTNNVTHFIVGHRGSFDHMATSAIQKAKKYHPELCALRLIAYHPSERPAIIPELFDNIYFPLALAKCPRRFAIEKANQFVLSESDVLVCFVSRSGGNSAELLRKAVRMEKAGQIQIINLANSALF